MARTATIGRISVNLSANTAEYQQNLRNAERSTKKSTKKMESDYTKLGKSIRTSLETGAKSAAVMTAAISAFIVASASARIEQNNLAEAAQLTVTEFDAVSAVFGTVGIEAEKTSDILRDLNLKIGEAATIGGGPAAEAMELLGINMNDIKDKTPIEQMEILNDRMQAMSLTADAQRTIWDSLSSDMDKIVPLLLDGAAGYKALKEEADRLVIAIPPDAIDSVQKSAFQLDIMRENANKLGTYIAGEFDVAVRDMNTELSSVINKFVVMNQETGDLTDTVSVLVSIFRQFYNVMEIAGSGISSAFAIGELAVAGFLNGVTYMSSEIGHTIESLSTEIGNEFTGAFDLVAAEYYELVGKIGEGLSFFDDDISNNLIDIADKGAAGVIASQEKVGASQKQIDDARAKRYTDYKNKEIELEKKALATLTRNGEVILGNIDDYIDATEQASVSINNLRDSTNGAGVIEAPKVEDVEASDTSGLFISSKDANDKYAAEQQLRIKQAADASAALEMQYVADVQKFVNSNEAKLVSEELYNAEILRMKTELEEGKLKIEAETKKKQSDDAIAAAEATAEIQELLLSGVADMGITINEDSSDATKALFVAQQGAAIAQGIVNTELAATKALATDPTGASSVAARVQGYAAVAVIGAQTIGAFHGGVDSVSPDMNNKSFLLKQGERVVQPASNKKLTAFLDNDAKNGGSGSSSTTINQTVNGGAMMSQGDFEQLLLRSSDSLAGIVSKKSRQYSQRK